LAYETSPLSMTLNDRQGHSPIASLFQMRFFRTVYAAVDKVSTVLERRAVPLSDYER